MEFKCKKCEIAIFFNINKLVDVDMKKVGLHCPDCYNEAETKLKEKRFVQEYKGNMIYEKDGNYIPYWECSYYFKSLEDCKARIDNSHVAIVSRRALHRMFS